MPFVVPPWVQPTSGYSVLTAPPTEEPISVDEAKLRAGLDWVETDPRQALLPKYIAAARSMVERDTGLALLTQERDIYVQPALTYPSDVLLPSGATPLQAITEVVPFDPTSGWPSPALAASAYRVLPRGVRLFSVPADGSWLRLHVIAGWPSAEALQADAPLLVQAVGLLVGHMLTLGRDLAVTGAVAAISLMPEGYEACIAPHRLIWVA